MKFRILTVGKLENKYYKALSEEYAKRISHYLSIEIDSVKQEKIASLSKNEILAREAGRLEQKMNIRDFTIAMDKEGKQMSSEMLSDYINSLAMRGIKQVTFVIGGPLGLDPEFLKKTQMKLSLSKMTLAHEMATVFLLEQLYRALTILRGEKYHK